MSTVYNLLVEDNCHLPVQFTPFPLPREMSAFGVRPERCECRLLGSVMTVPYSDIVVESCLSAFDILIGRSRHSKELSGITGLRPVPVIKS